MNGIYLIFIGIILLIDVPILGIICIAIGLSFIKTALDSKKKTNIEKRSSENDAQNKLYVRSDQRNLFKKHKSSTNTYNQRNNSGTIYETYVDVRFDNYYRTYTYLAPIGRLLKAGERINIVTNDGIKSVTVVNGNYKCLKKTDMIYRRIKIR